jgi:3-oxoacyl-(acyl-carrier-protein) synthase
VKFLNGAGELATQAAHDAWRDAAAEDAASPEASGLWLSQMDTWDWPCVDFQTAVRDATDDLTKPLEAEALNRSSVRRTKPFFLLDSLKNNAFSFVTRWWSLRGANTGVAGFAGPTLGLLDLAARAIARGDQERALVVAAARAANGVLRRDLVLHGLSRPSGDPASRPLDTRGTGCVLGEAAAALTVERQETASARGAEVRATFLGYAGATGEPLAEMQLAPRAETLRAAAAGALDRAAIEAGDLLGVVLPALGLPEADAAMLAALDDLPAAAGAPRRLLARGPRAHGAGGRAGRGRPRRGGAPDRAAAGDGGARRAPAGRTPAPDGARRGGRPGRAGADRGPPGRSGGGGGGIGLTPSIHPCRRPGGGARPGSHGAGA